MSGDQSEQLRDFTRQMSRVGAAYGRAAGAMIVASRAFNQAVREGVLSQLDVARRAAIGQLSDDEIEARRMRAWRREIEAQRQLGLMHVRQLGAQARRELGLP